MHPYQAILFDLLTALLDSWSLWNTIAGDDNQGRIWRAEYLRLTYQTGPYRPYTDLVAQAAENVSLPRALANHLDANFVNLQPWPEANQVLQSVKAAGIPIGVVTNCSERLGQIAASRVGVDFQVIVTAERAGFYKPKPQPYQLALLELNLAPHQCLFVAGSAYDLFGTGPLNIPTYWHNRIGLTAPANAPRPIAQEQSLTPLVSLLRLGVSSVPPPSALFD